MRFLTLKDQTILPVEEIRRRFRNEEVRSVLPARGADERMHSLLVATTSALAIVTGVPGAERRRWMTRWAPWDAVRIVGPIETRHERSGDRHHLAVAIDRLSFDSYLPGEVGLRAMRDFVHVARDRQSEVARTWMGAASPGASHASPPAR